MKRTNTRHRNRLISCEPMENRLLFVTINGTNAANAISVSIDGNDILYAVDGNSERVLDALHFQIEINGLGGNDTITIAETGLNTVTVNAGAGIDTINLALGANDMDAIDDFVTINGDADTDTVNLCDNANSSPVAFSLNSGNVIGRTNMPSVTVNAEIVEVRGGTSVDTFNVADAPSFLVTRLLGNAGSDVLNLVGAAGETARFQPNAAVSGGGSVFFPADDSSLTFSSMDSMQAQNFDDFTLATPNPNDTITINSGNTLAGSSGGVAFCTVVFTNLASLTLDVGENDSGAGNDTILLAGTVSEADLIRVDAGIGTNTLTNTGTYRIDTELGASLGNNLTVTSNGGTLTLDGTQHLKRVELNNNATLGFFDTSVLNVQTLAVVNGDATIRGTTSHTNSISASTSISIAAGRTLNRISGGVITFTGTQAHGAGSFFNASGGITNFNNDLGSAASRPLSLDATGATINFNTTQHLNVISTGLGGLVRVNSNGSRVLVCNGVFVSDEGSAIDLSNNDMIVDYTNVADANAVRTLLRNGRANGAWTGNGINSSSASINPLHNTTLGSMEATEFKSIYGAAATFDGQALDNTAVLIKYTYYGDADFNGVVNFDDYSRTDAGFNGSLSGWLNGDYDDNGDVNFDDYSLIDNAFNTQGGALRGPGWLSQAGKIRR